MWYIYQSTPRYAYWAESTPYNIMKHGRQVLQGERAQLVMNILHYPRHYAVYANHLDNNLCGLPCDIKFRWFMFGTSTHCLKYVLSLLSRCSRTCDRLSRSSRCAEIIWTQEENIDSHACYCRLLPRHTSWRASCATGVWRGACDSRMLSL